MSDVSASEKQDEAAPIEEALKNERYELLRRLEDSLETPMLILAFVWLALLVVELVWGESLLFEIIGTIIWVIFILDFAVEFVLAPHKVAYLKRNWLIAMSLLIPALRLFRCLPGVSAAPAGPRGAEFAFAPRRQLAEPRHACARREPESAGLRLRYRPHGTGHVHRRGRDVRLRERGSRRHEELR